MRAMHMTEPGKPEVLQPVQVAEPEIQAPTDIKVAIKAAGVNPIDTKLRQRGLLFADALPAILGCDGAGVVVAVGAAVTDYQPGDRVWFCHGGLGREAGNYAEYTVLPAPLARPLPATVDFISAAAAPLVLITAWEALYERARLQSGHEVLIHGGAGGVGHVAIQLAKLAGSRVFTTISNDAKLAFVKQLGADEVINYTCENMLDRILSLTNNQGVDIALDTVGGAAFRQTIAAMAHYGDLVTLLDPGTDVDWKEARTRNLRIGFELMLTPMLRDLPEARARHGLILDQCAEHLQAGRLKIHVSQVLELEDAAAAHRLIEQGHTQGKIVLRVND